MGNMLADTFCINTESVFFTCSGMNMIGTIDLDTRMIKYIMGPKNEPFFFNHLYDGIQVLDDELFVFPYNAKDGYVYSFKKKKWDTIKSLFDGKANGKEQVCGSVVFKDKIYIVSDYFGDVICYDPKKKTFDFPFELSKKIGEVAFGGQTIGRNGNCLYIARQYTNNIIKCNMDTCEVEVIDIDGGGAFIGTCYDGEYIWIVPKDSSNKLIKWNERDRVIEAYEIPSKKYIWGILPLGEDYLIYGYNEDTYVFNAESGTFAKYDKAIYRACWLENEQLLMSTCNGEIILCHNGKVKDTFSLEDKKMDEYYKQNAKEIAESICGTIIHEEKEIQLLDYLDIISN